MVTAKNPGIGQGKGGGGRKPKRAGVALMQLRLSTEAASLLEAHAEAAKLPLWRVVDDLVKVALGGQAPPEPPPKLSPVAQEVLREIAAFLDHHEDRRVASRVLRKAWGQALLLASHDLKRRAASPPEPEEPLLS